MADAARAVQREREELALIFDRPLSGAVRLEQLERQQRQLVRHLQERYERDERVLYNGLAITGEPPAAQRAPVSPYAPVVHSVLPLMQFAPLLIDAHHDTGFLDEIGHYGQGARGRARLGQLLAALIAEMTGMGFARMAQACAYTEKEMRHAARQLTDENLDAASARRIQATRLLPDNWMAQLFITSSDGSRWETIGKSPLGQFAARHAGYRRRMLTRLLWLTDQYGLFGSKVIPVNEPESWHTLDLIVHLDPAYRQHTTDTHGTTELSFAVADLLGRDFVPRLKDINERRLWLLGEPDPTVPAEQLLSDRARRELIDEQYEELQRIAGSIKRGWIIPSILISEMAFDPSPGRTGKALREYGRVIETNFILRWASDPHLRARSHAQLNKGEHANGLERALAYAKRGRILARDVAAQPTPAEDLKAVIGSCSVGSPKPQLVWD